ncbi:MAG: ABC transporter ATP-binding protein [Rickettsiales bacterium]|nr:MAG: ABC transporter ATP-binding protein [Rickettsiales bacterium]
MDSKLYANYEVDVWKSITPFFKKYKWSLLVYFALSFVLVDYIWSFIIQYVWADLVNKFATKTFSFNTDFFVFCFYVFLTQSETFFKTVAYPFKYNINISLPYNITNHYYEKLLANSISFFNDNMVGTLSSKISQLSTSAKDFIDIILELITIFTIILSMSIVLLNYNAKLSLIVLAWAFVYVIINKIFLSRTYTIETDIADLKGALSGKIVDSFTNIVNAKIFVKEAFEKGNVKKTITEIKIKEVKKFFAYTYKNTIDVLMLGGIIYYAFYLLITSYFASKINLTELLFTTGLFLPLVTWTERFSERLLSITECFANMKSSLLILENTTTINDSPEAKEIIITQQKPEIEFKNISFKYKETLPLVFDDFSLQIKGGEKVGIVGHTGAGKSSFVNLLMRFYDTNEGQILISGYDIKKDFTQKSLRKNISYIPQEPILFHRTIRENIIYGDIKATNMQLIEACKKAYCYEFIQNLENGFETIVGERGVKLSGGQKQRIAIARAFLKNSSILILDEPTSALDSITEDYIQKTLSQLMENKTIITIAHRLSTIKTMDKIVVLEEGKIIEYGSVDTLLHTQGSKFKKMWDLQKNGILGEE